MRKTFDLIIEYVSGHTYKTSDEAERALSESDIVIVNPDGAVFTAYVFADNYFEMYINGIPVGKDAVSFTAFNSSIIRFKAKKPFTISVYAECPSRHSATRSTKINHSLKISFS